MQDLNIHTLGPFYSILISEIKKESWKKVIYYINKNYVYSET